jgi:hypothetical protein
MRNARKFEELMETIRSGCVIILRRNDRLVPDSSEEHCRLLVRYGVADECSRPGAVVLRRKDGDCWGDTAAEGGTGDDER